MLSLPWKLPILSNNGMKQISCYVIQSVYEHSLEEAVPSFSLTTSCPHYFKQLVLLRLHRCIFFCFFLLKHWPLVFGLTQ